MHLSCFTKNKPASGCFWAISVTVHTVNKILIASKICSFLVQQILLILLQNVKEIEHSKFIALRPELVRLASRSEAIFREKNLDVKIQITDSRYGFPD